MFRVSEWITHVSDHRELLAKFACTRGHRKRNQIHFRKSNLIFDFKNNCDTIVNKNNHYFLDLLDKHALLKTIYVHSCGPNHWITEKIMSAKRKRRKDERI